jgi:hypothetical protein
MNVLNIYSELYSGQTAQIIFYPLSGGTIDLGFQLIPYNYDADYYLGTYILKFSGTDIECSVVVIPPSPTPTNTPTVTPTNTETPTQTPSPTVTPTNTETPTQTPTNTPTPSITPTNTETPTQTPSQTKPFTCD